mmetsp:Transcript_35345/g.54111  ORF Transcript_35345/g.54111 Transcript_35345/m.54111 type:complete len:112 (+) Transcript_35345:1086-1421(+)
MLAKQMTFNAGKGVTVKDLDKIFWKSEHVLDILLRNCSEDKILAEKTPYQKLVTFWRNTHVSRMVPFIGFKYSGFHFVHSIALKPFYACSPKITIFFLSQFFQSMRWNTNF